MTFTYDQAASAEQIEWWLTHIDYTGLTSPSRAPNRRVVFEYNDGAAARPDTMTSWSRGTKITLARRLTRVKMEAPATAGATERTLVRSYRLTYDLGALSKRSRVREVTMCDAGEVCLPPLRFDYSEPTPSFVKTSSGSLGDGVDINTRDTVEAGFLIGDLNGDARDDLVLRSTDRWHVRYGLATGGFGTAVAQSDTLPPRDGGTHLEFPYLNRLVQLTDFDGDGRQEMMIEAFTGSGWKPRLYRKVTSYEGSGEWVLHAQLPISESAAPRASSMARLIDVNGDGLTDLVDWAAVDKTYDFTLRKKPAGGSTTWLASKLLSEGDGPPTEPSRSPRSSMRMREDVPTSSKGGSASRSTA